MSPWKLWQKFRKYVSFIKRMKNVYINLCLGNTTLLSYSPPIIARQKSQAASLLKNQKRNDPVRVTVVTYLGKIMPRAICVILFLMCISIGSFYRYTRTKLCRARGLTIRSGIEKGKDGENQRNSIILPSQEVRHIRFRRLSARKIADKTLEWENISSTAELCAHHERIISSLEIFFRSQSSLAYRYSTFSRPEGAYFAFRAWFLKTAAMKTWGFMRESVFSLRGSSKIRRVEGITSRNRERKGAKQGSEKSAPPPGRVEWKYNERKGGEKIRFFSARIYFHFKLYSHLCIVKGLLVVIHN